ncbi:MAG: hypothetical protein NTV22_11320 [bacterium]|nr:hypothetical protein [bacterium]
MAIAYLKYPNGVEVPVKAADAARLRESAIKVSEGKVVPEIVEPKAGPKAGK